MLAYLPIVDNVIDIKIAFFKGNHRIRILNVLNS